MVTAFLNGYRNIKSNVRNVISLGNPGEILKGKKGTMMIRVYLYQKSGGEQPDYSWQHEMGQKLLYWARKQPENDVLCCHNISHSGNLVAVAVADMPVGVDVETQRSVKRRVMDKVLSEKEQQYLLQAGDCERAFLQFWTLKECYGKALGVGIAYPLRKVEFMPQETVSGKNWQKVFCSDAGVSCFSMFKTAWALSVCGCSADAPEPLLYLLQNDFSV